MTMSGNQSGGFCLAFGFCCQTSLSDFSLGPVPKHRRVIEERAPAAAAPSDVVESSRRAGGAESQSLEIPVGEPIVPPYNGLKVLLVARLLHAGKITGVSPDAEEVEESSDSLLEEIRASPPPFECYHGE